MNKATKHMIKHDITTLANIPLFLWVMYALYSLRDASYEAFVDWMGMPLNLIMAALFVIIGFKHFAMELQVVFEDYISAEKCRGRAINLTKFIFLATALLALASLIKIAI